MDNFKDIYRGKTVLITGHTGFKGSWLTIWLKELGAKVVGYSLEEGFDDGIFKLAKLKEKIIHLKGDVRNFDQLKKAFDIHKPEFVFHLAAQSLVRVSFEDPVLTFETNVLGTVNVLENIRESSSVKAAIIVTSDKCYKNKEWIHGYRENDELGGSDPYSASKSCAEIVVDSYYKSFISKTDKKVASVRAGNVIGGGDWAQHRIIPDCVKALLKGKPILLRNPEAIRPWQHVLDPLNGYLLLCSLLSSDQKYVGAWNFGPDMNSVLTVKQISEKLIEKWGSGSWQESKNADEEHKEAKLLNLDSSKSNFFLDWSTRLDIDCALKLLVEWYKNYSEEDVYNLCQKQIVYFTKNVKK